MAKTRATIDEWSTESNLLQISSWVKEGLTIEQIASKIGIGKRTFYDWTDRNRHISHAIERGRMMRTEMAKVSLYQLALFKNTTRKIVLDKDGDEREIWEEHLPNVKALELILANEPEFRKNESIELDIKGISQAYAQQEELCNHLQDRIVEGVDDE